MKILVAIANYGTKSINYLQRVIDEYRTMPFEVSIVVLSDKHKELGNDIEVIVGLPTKDPWSLPFNHQKLFADRINDYDIFIYSEDDILISRKNIESFVDVQSILPKPMIAGFTVYELDSNGKKYYPGVHGSYRWVPESVISIKGHTFAHFTNLHSCCYMLNREQLCEAIASGGYIVPPHKGKYDLLCSAATDPYSQCGFRKVICIERINDFDVHHLPNKYVGGKMGIGQDEYMLQVNALNEIINGNKSKYQLFEIEKTINTSQWDKLYYESYADEIIEFIPKNANTILSIGCGSGATEERFVQEGYHVDAIPLDDIISEVAKSKNIDVTPPSFDEAWTILKDKKYDCIIISDVVQHLSEPVETLKKYLNLISDNGVILIRVPNFDFIKVKKDLIEYGISRDDLIYFEKSRLNITTKNKTKKLIKEYQLKMKMIKYIYQSKYSMINDMTLDIFKKYLASRLIFVCHKY